MLSSPSSRRSTCFLVPAVLAIGSMACAQTLVQRPATKAAPPADKPVPVSPISASTILPQGTSLQVEIDRNYPMRAGEAIEARLMHPIYAAGRLAVPANTHLSGRVISLEPDTKTRWHGRLRGDFTPFHKVQVQFNQLILPSGPLDIAATPATNGAPVLLLSAPGVKPKQSFIAREWEHAKGQVHDRIAYFTDPGVGDRALQLLYHQLPYHPERIDAHTAWSFELNAPLDLPEIPTGVSVPATPTNAKCDLQIWSVHGVLGAGLTSARAKPGDTVEALVVDPVFDCDKQLVVPQGSTLIGKVSVAKPAKSFGRNGNLRFTFQQVRFPGGFNRPVEGALAGAETEKTQNLSLDAEGNIKPRNQASAIAPLLLTMLAGRALDQDGNLTVQTGVASNGFGLVGRVVGLALGNRNIAAGIGFYAAGLSFYDNFLHSGRDVVFPKDTRIEIETTPMRALILKPDEQ